MPYWIYYPKSRNAEISVTRSKKPADWLDYAYAWGEGPYPTKEDVIKRLNWMNIPAERRPEDFRMLSLTCPPGYKRIHRECRPTRR